MTEGSRLRGLSLSGPPRIERTAVIRQGGGRRPGIGGSRGAPARGGASAQSEGPRWPRVPVPPPPSPSPALSPAQVPAKRPPEPLPERPTGARGGEGSRQPGEWFRVAKTDSAITARTGERRRHGGERAGRRGAGRACGARSGLTASSPAALPLLRGPGLPRLGAG